MSRETPEVREALAAYATEAPETEGVPPGYRQTGVGVIPEDWEVKRLGDLCQIISGGTPSTSIQAFWDGEIPWCTPTDVTQNGDKYLSETNRTISDEGLKRSSTVLLPSGTLLLCSRATVGEIKIAAAPVCTNQGFKSLVCGRDADNEFLFYKLLTLKDKLLEKGVGSTFLEVSKKDVASLEIPLPGLEEQTAIAAALSDVDDLISALDSLIAKKRAVKTAAMQRLLTGEQRLPGFSGEWEVKRLGDVIKRIVGGGTPSRSNPAYWGDEIPWVTVKDFASFDPYRTQEAITREGLKYSASNLIPKGTVIMSTRMALGKAVIYEVDVSINQDLKAIFPTRDTDSRFLYFWFEHNADIVEGLGGGSTVKGISLQDLKSVEFLKAPLEEQTAIAAVLSDMDAEISALEARREKRQQVKQGMMQELLTGRARLV